MTLAPGFQPGFAQELPLEAAQDRLVLRAHCDRDDASDAAVRN